MSAVSAAQAPIGLCYGSLRTIDADALVAVAGEAGFCSLMLPPFPVSACASPAEFRALLRRNGIRRVVLDGAMGMLPRCPAAAEYGMSVAAHLDAARRFAVDCFNVPHYRGDPATPVPEFVDALAPFCEQAAVLGATVALEFLPGTGIPDLERALRIVQAVGMPNIGIALDSWHWARTQGTVADVRALPAGCIRDCQLNDRPANAAAMPDSEQFGRLVPGEGALPLEELVRAVWDNAPGLPLNLEVFSHGLHAMDPREAAARLAAGIRGVIARLPA